MIQSPTNKGIGMAAIPKTILFKLKMSTKRVHLLANSVKRQVVSTISAVR